MKNVTTPLHTPTEFIFLNNSWVNKGEKHVETTNSPK